jgi:glutathione S-transferase
MRTAHPQRQRVSDEPERLSVGGAPGETLSMKLHWSPRSPYVRKVMIVAHETGLVNGIALQRSVASMTIPNDTLMQDNPLGKIPTLLLADGTALYDSLVICEYLDSLHSGEKLFPTSPAARWAALRLHALSDGALDALILWRNETLRPEATRSALLLVSFRKKIEATLSALDRDASTFGNEFTIGHVATVCCAAYLDFRFADLEWRARAPQLAAWYEGALRRPSVEATRIVNDEGVR